MPAEFALSEESLGEGRHVVAVRGEIDLFTAPELKKTLADAIENGASRVVVDLSETTFLDSTALGVLIGGHLSRRLRKAATAANRVAGGETDVRVRDAIGGVVRDETDDLAWAVDALTEGIEVIPIRSS